MKSSQSNFDLRLPGSYLVRSYLITTALTTYLHKAHRMKRRQGKVVKNPQISNDVVYERPPFAIAHGSE